jgi:hypothetical protein
MPSISTLRFTSSNEGTQSATDTDNEESSAMTIRSPARGASTSSTTLETVQEISQPSTPAAGLDATLNSALAGPTEEPNGIDQVFTHNHKSRSKPGAVDSGSESGERKGEIKMRSTTSRSSTLRPSLVPSLKSGTGLTGSSGTMKKATEGSTTKNMTVETETVSSIPQVAVGGGATVNGTLRAKPSSETIRPKKEKKKTARKAPSVASGIGEPPNSSRTRSKSRLHHHPSLRSMSDASIILSPSDSSYPATAHGRFASTPPVSADFRLPSLSSYVNRVLMMPPRLASSKADIFEAKIAIAVDEANSSDSEETFVYESNPPDHERPRRYHSRTPSATSMASQIDQRGNSRSMHGNMDTNNGQSVATKKSMKFANSFNLPPDSGGGDDDGTGSNRDSMGTGRGTIRHHHIGRWGRNRTNGHASLFDNESPFPNAAKSKSGGNTSRQSSRPTSPRVSNGKFGKKNSPISSGYDIDDGAGADDERTPLMPTSIRSARSGRHRRPLTSSSRHLEHQGPRRNQSFLTRFAGCLVLSIMILLVMSGAIGFLFATTQPLFEVKILALKKVLASQQELMFNIEVQARNPNIMAVTMDTLSMSVYARSKHAGSDSEWYARPPTGTRMGRGLRIAPEVAVRDDSPWDPFPDDPDGRPLLLLGRIESFDNPLFFDGSPFRHTHAISTGEVRLSKPGNSTEAGGSERWEKVIKYEFDLIVQGILNYQLPFSQRMRSAQVSGQVVVEPDGERGDAGIGAPHWDEGARWDELPVYDEPRRPDEGEPEHDHNDEGGDGEEASVGR